MGTPLKNGYVACEISIGEPSKIFVLMLYCIVVLYRYTVSRYTELLYCIVSRYIYNIYIYYIFASLYNPLSTHAQSLGFRIQQCEATAKSVVDGAYRCNSQSNGTQKE